MVARGVGMGLMCPPERQLRRTLLSQMVNLGMAHLHKSNLSDRPSSVASFQNLRVAIDTIQLIVAES